jgi:hypothetical protein
MSKIQMENIEIKYNYALIKDEIDNKDKKIKNLEKQIELRDIIIKEIKALDFSNNNNNNKTNNNINNDELKIKYKILLSEQEKTKYKAITSSINNNHNLTEANIEKNNAIDINNETTSIIACKSQNKNKRKHFSFHPRNASFVKSNQIQTPNRRFSEMESSVLNNNTEKEKNCFNFNFNCSELVTLENNK